MCRRIFCPRIKPWTYWPLQCLSTLCLNLRFFFCFSFDTDQIPILEYATAPEEQIAEAASRGNARTQRTFSGDGRLNDVPTIKLHWYRKLMQAIPADFWEDLKSCLEKSIKVPQSNNLNHRGFQFFAFFNCSRRK